MKYVDWWIWRIVSCTATPSLSQYWLLDACDATYVDMETMSCDYTYVINGYDLFNFRNGTYELHQTIYIRLKQTCVYEYVCIKYV